MPTFNPETSLAQVALRLPVIEALDTPEDWFSRLNTEIPGRLVLNADQTAAFNAHLNKYIGADFSDPRKEQLLDTLKIIYAFFTHSDFSADQKTMLGERLLEALMQENVSEVYDHTNQILISILGIEIPRILALNAADTAIFQNNLNIKAGPAATYNLKDQLHASLKIITAALINAKIAADQKTAIAFKLLEGIDHCTPGFHDRTNETLESLGGAAESMDELLAHKRQTLVRNVADAVIKNARTAHRLHEPSEIHAHNQVFIIAQTDGFGVRPLTMGHAYQNALQAPDITYAQTELTKTFAEQYSLFSTLNSTYEEIMSLLYAQGYMGKRAAGYAYEDYSKFDNDFLKPFLSISFPELFEYEEEEHEDAKGVSVYAFKVLDLHWDKLKLALLQSFQEKNYFIFNPEETDLLTLLMAEGMGLDEFKARLAAQPATTLFPHFNEFIACLEYFKDWPAEKKGLLVEHYIKDKLGAEQKQICDLMLQKVPGMKEVLKVIPSIADVYAATLLTENKLDDMLSWFSEATDINRFLPILVSKKTGIDFLRAHPELRERITEEGIKPVVEGLVKSRNGRRLLIEDERLQSLIPRGEIADSPDWIAKAIKEQAAASMRMFAPPRVNPEVAQLLLHVARGEQDEAERMLRANPKLLLMKGSMTDSDYSGRTFEDVSALQLALWARDRHMWVMMDITSMAAASEITAQIEELDTDGITYRLGGQEYTETEYSFDALKQAYQEYNAYYVAHRTEYSVAVNREINRLWLKVGMAQRMAAPHVIQEYCRPDRPFMMNDDYDHPLPPDFNEAGLVRAAKYYGGDPVYPFRASFQLGEDFGLFRGRGRGPRGGAVGAGWGAWSRRSRRYAAYVKCETENILA